MIKNIISGLKTGLLAGFVLSIIDSILFLKFFSNFFQILKLIKYIPLILFLYCIVLGISGFFFAILVSFSQKSKQNFRFYNFSFFIVSIISINIFFYVNEYFLPGFFKLTSIIGNILLILFTISLFILSYKISKKFQKRIVFYKNIIKIGSTIAVFIIFLFLFKTPVFKTFVNLKTPKKSAPYNIILITIDALQPAHLSCYGYNRLTSPNIDKLASSGTLFYNVITPAVRTGTSFAATFTGQYPHTNGVRDTRFYTLSKKNTTLAEILQKNGYKTQAFVHNSILDKSLQLNQGFDNYVVKWNWMVWPKIPITTILSRLNTSLKNIPKVSAETITQLANKWIYKNKDKRFFLWLHYLEPHMNYEPPYPYYKIFDPNYTGKYLKSFDYHLIPKDKMIFENPLSKNDIYHAIALYDGEILFCDKNIGILIDNIRKLKLFDNTLILLAADHGESLGDHNFFFDHGDFLYESSIKVPLIMTLPPKIPVNKKISSQIQTIDFFPTILEILNIPYNQNIDGKSFLPLILGTKDSIRENTFAETGLCFFPKKNKRLLLKPDIDTPLRNIPTKEWIEKYQKIFIDGKLRMIRTNEWKLIYTPAPDEQEPVFELYNLKKDPQELVNVIDKNEMIAKKLKNELFSWINEDKNKLNIIRNDKNMEKRLKSLGYLE